MDHRFCLLAFLLLIVTMCTSSRAHVKRRAFLKQSAGVAASIAVAGPQAVQTPSVNAIQIDPTPQFELSPYLYMQFMEPLGTTDGSVEAAWDHSRDQWRDDVVEVAKALAPPMMRWGGIFTRFLSM